MMKSFLAAEERLHEEAISSTGLSDFGDPAYREGLRQLLAARDASGIEYPGDGETILAPIRQLLAARLSSIEQISKADNLPPLERPIFILGLPRTGTTAMQRLLLSDPQMQGLEYWLGENPMPRPPRADWENNSIYRACQERLDAMNILAPAIGKMHPMAAAKGEECRLVMEQSFAHSSFSLVAPIRPYQDWLFAADLEPHYRHYQRVLQLIGSTSPKRTWVLKCPHHAPQVDSLLRVFPDARIICMHRPLENLIPSVVRLAESFLGLVEGPDIDMNVRAQMIVENIDLTLQRLMATQKANPGRFHNISMSDFVADPLAELKRTYAKFGISINEKSQAGIQSWVEANSQKKSPSMSAAMPYGLDQDALRERFSYYKDMT